MINQVRFEINIKKNLDKIQLNLRELYKDDDYYQDDEFEKWENEQILKGTSGKLHFDVNNYLFIMKKLEFKIRNR